MRGIIQCFGHCTGRCRATAEVASSLTGRCESVRRCYRMLSSRRRSCHHVMMVIRFGGWSSNRTVVRAAVTSKQRFCFPTTFSKFLFTLFLLSIPGVHTICTKITGRLMRNLSFMALVSHRSQECLSFFRCGERRTYCSNIIKEKLKKKEVYIGEKRWPFGLQPFRRISLPTIYEYSTSRESHSLRNNWITKQRYVQSLSLSRWFLASCFDRSCSSSCWTRFPCALLVSLMVLFILSRGRFYRREESVLGSGGQGENRQQFLLLLILTRSFTLFQQQQ